MPCRRKSAPLLCLLLLVPSLSADVINFDSLSDSDIVTNQFSGLSFSNATILTSGISLNDFELPPQSGVNVVFDDGGPITIDFLAPIQHFGGYFTYYLPLTLTGFDSSNVQVALATSAFSSNVACLAGPPCLGDPGSSPNEFLSLAFGGGFSRVTIAGNPGGGSFALDDLTYETRDSQTLVPEPAYSVLLLGAAIMISIRVRSSFGRQTDRRG